MVPTQTATTDSTAEPTTTDVPVGALMGRGLALALTLLAALALLSYDARDSQIMAGGFGPTTSIHNWIGRFGAWFADAALAWFGLAVFPTLAIVLICVVRRLRGTGVKPWRGSYVAGILVFLWGASMALGVFPNFWPTLTGRLNLSELPGGVLGQRFCAPGSALARGGWMSYVVNPTGSLIVAGTMMLLGLATVWFFDWHERTLDWWQALQEYWLAPRTTTKNENLALWNVAACP